MKTSEAWPVGVCVFPEPDLNRPHTSAYPQYVHEILAHAGVCYGAIQVDDLERQLERIRVLVTVGERALPDAVKNKLRQWVSSGGAWLSVGGLCGVDDVLGAKLAPPYEGFGAGARTLGEGYLQAEAGGHPVLGHLNKPLHYFNGLAVLQAGGKVLATALDAHGRTTDQPLIIEQALGAGRCLLIAADVTGTVVHVQQGRAITRDGIAAPDGSAPINDAVLKSGDGGVLDWIFDREEVPGTPGFKAFLQPVADLWRELLLRAILYLAREQDVPLPMLWLWPRNLPAVATMSHDTDDNEPEKAWKLLELLKTAEINTTWCVILPGYSPEIMAAIKSAGHELATHYDSMTQGLPWCEEQFDRQWRGLKAFFNEMPVCNKNHYLRWEGDMEFFDWCAQRGIQLDQSKGASKTGEAGFNFGTCHVYFPVRFNGEKVDVLELATPTQDLNVFAPETLLEPLLDAAVKNHGVCHLLFHPAHVGREAVCQALLRAARTAKQRGLEWWPAGRINAWQRARRQVQWSEFRTENGGASVVLQTGKPLNDATILWLSQRSAEVMIEGKASTTNSVTRWGFHFTAATADLAERKECRIGLKA